MHIPHQRLEPCGLQDLLVDESPVLASVPKVPGSLSAPSHKASAWWGRQDEDLLDHLRRRREHQPSQWLVDKIHVLVIECRTLAGPSFGKSLVDFLSGIKPVPEIDVGMRLEKPETPGPSRWDGSKDRSRGGTAGRIIGHGGTIGSRRGRSRSRAR